MLMNTLEDEKKFYGPTQLCNNTKFNNHNQGWFARNFPCNKMKVTYDFRPDFSASKGGKCITRNLNDRYDYERDSSKNIENDECCSLNPGKGTFKGYVNNINLDSDLRCLNRKWVRCPQRKYTICDSVSNDLKNRPICSHTHTPNTNIRTVTHTPMDQQFEVNPQVGIVGITNKQASNGDAQIMTTRGENVAVNKCIEHGLVGCKEGGVYMKGPNVSSAVSDTKANIYNDGQYHQWNGYKPIHRLEYNKYKDIVRFDYPWQYARERDRRMNSHPFSLENVRVALPVDPKEPCNNMFNNMTKSKGLRGQRFVRAESKDYCGFKGDNLLD
jgi:hypothetical protein